jgi:hypothetical protein
MVYVTGHRVVVVKVVYTGGPEEVDEDVVGMEDLEDEEGAEDVGREE